MGKYIIWSLSELTLDFCFIFRSKDGNPLSADDIKIRCGEYDLKLGEIDQYDYQDRNVDTFTIHPFFSGMETLKNDIAVIHTKEAFKQAPNVNRICLPGHLLKGIDNKTVRI